MFLGLLVFITALSISAVAIYYSIAGLVAIFAAAAIPIMVMGGALEIGKLVTAVWLHRYWKRTVWWLKYYLSVAVLVLMFITSMGIFGFLSKAHIEQTSASTESIEQVERIKTELARMESIIVRAESKIAKAEDSTGNRNDDINAQIEKEQKRIDSAYTRIQPAIEEQQKIIADARDADSDRTKPYEDQLTNIKEEIRRLETTAREYEEKIAGLKVDNSAVEPIQAQIANINDTINKVEGQIASGESEQIKQAQLTIGSNADGQAGPNTRRSANTWIVLQKERISELQNQIAEIRIEAKTTVDSERTRLGSIVNDIREKQIPALKDREIQMLAKIDTVRATESPIVTTARDEIARIRKSADDQVKASNELIQQLREKIKVDGGVDVDAIVDEQLAKIKTANTEIDKLTEQKYTLEAEYRKLEAEVGPIKYIAELIYGEDVDRDILEKAVRWVIITIIFVFDPLAVLLLIASQYTFEWRRNDVNAIRKDDGDVEPEPQKEPEPTPDDKMEEAMGDNKFEDVSDKVLEEENKKEFWEENQVDWNKNAMEYGTENEDDLKFMLEKADPEVLEEVAKELNIEKPVDIEPYDPYNDNREDEELSPEELDERQNMKLYSPNGKLAINPGNKKVKSVKIKSIAEKAEDNKKDNEE
tara:strand:+ start:978 stop:2921 length:1944 start_codon:yes stop_codon:yes gene_type:complete